ncbi:MAG: class II aldolase/adducin family protein, partial [Firmicutes bacterium]|nr:class II aldolase/adducin family protein [Bacillota bacterium]
MIYEFEEAKEKILAACREMKDAQLIQRTWGNVSARISDKEFLITPSGKDYDEMTGEDLVKVRIRDEKWEGRLKPSSEKGMHARLYRIRPECTFIIHTHQTNASAISIQGEDLELSEMAESLVTEEERAILGPVVPCAEYGLSSTVKLAKNVAYEARTEPEARAILMHHHGVVCMGSDEQEAMAIAKTLETVCGRIYEKRCGEKILTGTGSILGREWQDGWLIHTRTPYVMEMSRRGKTLKPYLDDMAQIGGINIPCVGTLPSGKEVRKALKDRNAVLIRGDGALCFAPDREEAEAVALVLEKNCQAANLGLKKAA